MSTDKLSVAPALALLLVSGIIGVISTSGGECGPFMAVEQSAITQVLDIPGSTKSAAATQVATLFAVYNTLGYTAQAAGSLVGGAFIEAMGTHLGFAPQAAMSLVFYGYGAIGGVNALLYWSLPKVRAQGGWRWLGLIGAGL